MKVHFNVWVSNILQDIAWSCLKLVFLRIQEKTLSDSTMYSYMHWLLDTDNATTEDLLCKLISPNIYGCFMNIKPLCACMKRLLFQTRAFSKARYNLSTVSSILCIDTFILCSYSLLSY